MVEQQETPAIELVCSHCQGDLNKVGVFEVRFDVTIWSKWMQQDGHWNITEETPGDTTGHVFNCGQCEKELPEGFSDMFWEMV